MIGEFFTILAGGAYLVGKGAQETMSRGEIATLDKEIAAITDKELENRLWDDIKNPQKYTEIWERIEHYKRSGGTFSREPAWEDVGKYRLTFFNKHGIATSVLLGNLEHGHLLLMQTYGKMPYARAVCRFYQK